MVIPSSQREGSNSEMVHEQRPLMSADLLAAAIKGNSDVLIRLLRLRPEEQRETQVVTDAFHPTSQQIEADQHDVQHLLGSATHFGDTLLHLLVTKKHNDLALMVFQRDSSLMKARNEKLETPLHCAAKVGNVQIIQALFERDPTVVKDALRKTQNNRDTALHVAARHGHGVVVHELMKLDPGVAYNRNMEGLSPLYIATVGGYTSMVETMLEDYPSLACEQYSNGMCPVHVAAQVGNIELVMHFMEKYSDDTKLLDHHGQNLLHIAAEENKAEVFTRLFALGRNSGPMRVGRILLSSTDYEGNTPLHVAAIKGHTSVLRAICKILIRREQDVRNNQGLTPFDLSLNRIEKNATKDMQRKINSYVESNGRHFTREWIDDIMQPFQNKWERIHIIGLGSVLITTVTFAAAFTVPGGYNQELGTPILGRKYMFKAFILANTQSFISAFTSLFTLVSSALVNPDAVDLYYATYTFIAAAGCMVVAFGLGSYLILAPVSLPIAIIILVQTLQLGSPFMCNAVEFSKLLFGKTLHGLNFEKYFARFGLDKVIPGTELEKYIEKFFGGFGLNKWMVFQIMAWAFLSIFLLALA